MRTVNPRSAVVNVLHADRTRGVLKAEQLLIPALVSLVLASAALAQRSTPIHLIKPDGAAQDSFGYSAAISGDTMIIGAPDDSVGANSFQGSATVYRWTGAGWAFEATLIATDGEASDWLGASVDLSGDTAVLGAPGDDVGAAANQGSAYVFVRNGSTWTQQAKLTAADGSADDQLGWTSAISGNTVVVGARLDDVGASADQGSAYVYVRSAGAWSQQAHLTAPDGAASDQFAFSVAVDGDTIAVGSPGDNVGANTNQGSAYVFVGSGTSWVLQAQLFALDGASLDQFGYRVDIDGESIVLGANFDDVGANANQGSAYVFTRSGGAWTQQAQFVDESGAADDLFGDAVAISGNTVIIGAPEVDVSTRLDQGAAHVFVRAPGGTTWTQQTTILAPDGAELDYLGDAVAIWGDVAVVGSFVDTVGANFDQGSVWVYSRVGSTWIGPDFQLLGSNGGASDFIGSPVAISGDTAIVGASGDDIVANADRGSAYVFTRSGSAWIQQAQLTAADGAANDNFGQSVAISGDTAVVGAYADDVGANVNQGSAYVFTRPPGGTTWSQQAQLLATGGASSDMFGVSVALDGDTALVGAYFDDVVAVVDQGSAYVFTRSGTTWTQQGQLIASDGAANDILGYCVALQGDTAVVGAYQDDIGANSNQGSAYVFTRSGTTWSQQAKLVASDGAAGDSLGASLAINAETVLVGAYLDDIGANTDQGSAYSFVRSGSTWSQQAKLVASDGASGDTFGYSAALSGDLAIVGAHQDDVGAVADQGSAYVFTRVGTSWLQQAKLVAADGSSGDRFGNAAALSGDTAIIGAYQDDVGASVNQGSAWILSVAYNDISSARNESLGTAHSTVSAALLSAQSGQQISASPRAWASIGSVDTLGRSLGLASTGDLRTPSTSIVTLGGSSFLGAPTGKAMDIHGQLRVSANASADVFADTFTLGSRGILTARSSSSLTINAPSVDLCGQTRLESGASLTFSGGATAIGPTTASFNSTLIAGATFENVDTFTITSGTISAPLFRNRAEADFFGASAVFGSLSNDVGAITTIRSGTLFVFGTLTNNGTIVGTICASCLNDPPTVEVAGGLALGSGANLSMAIEGSTVRVGGAFDCAIDEFTRFDMASATLNLEGTGAEQTLEMMSKDVGPIAAGLDRAPRAFPIGSLQIGPSPSTVRLVDAHDNDGLGQTSPEAIYVDTLRIDAGSRLINTAGRIYYHTLVNNGVVDAPANLTQITPPCPADLDNGSGVGTPDGGVDINDLLFFLAKFEQGHLAADLDNGTNTGTPDGGVDINDLLFFLAHFEAGC